MAGKKSPNSKQNANTEAYHTLAESSVSDLQDECKYRGLASTGSKDDLMRRLYKANEDQDTTIDGFQSDYERRLEEYRNSRLDGIVPFTLFNKFPKEIRLTIWEFELPGPRALCPGWPGLTEYHDPNGESVGLDDSDSGFETVGSEYDGDYSENELSETEGLDLENAPVDMIDGGAQNPPDSADVDIEGSESEDFEEMIRCTDPSRRLQFPKHHNPPNPAVLSACRESQEVALKRYRLCFGTHNVYANLDVDILYFGRATQVN
ncbi:hypothetical protein G7Y89_g9349 [Cudoniella acicularis]|uniref:SAP domain-containing protein n=1 Tax=Cudoniella acicularis TaxID=354080 RepID=A0A8H4REU4_9HELO|nr:hypothetical protein G7Y89_g9349 [Cudoniella acicularis]